MAVAVLSAGYNWEQAFIAFVGTETGTGDNFFLKLSSKFLLLLFLHNFRVWWFNGLHVGDAYSRRHPAATTEHPDFGEMNHLSLWLRHG